MKSCDEIDKTMTKEELIAAIEMMGKCIVERDDGGFYGTPVGYYVMVPDGQVYFASNKKDAERICKKWFKKKLGIDEGTRIGVGFVEWRL